jgi:hypothetical protein
VFSKVCAVALLIAFFALATLIMGDSIFISLALVLFSFDANIFGLGHEIRAYELGAFFVTAAAVFFYKYLYQAANPRNLLLLGLFSVGAILCHYLSACVVLVFVGYLVFYQRSQIFKTSSILVLLVPIALMALYFGMAFSGFQHMAVQNSAIKEKFSKEGFSFLEVFIRTCSFTSRNFRVFFTAFNPNKLLAVGSLFILIGIYVAALKLAVTREMKRNLNLLFILGCSSSVFMAMLSIKSHHYMSFYNRYFIFCLPFAVLFMACALQVFYESVSVKKVLSIALLGVIVAPCIFVYTKFFMAELPKIKYNHSRIADKVLSDKVEKLLVPEMVDAMLVQCFLPASTNLQYSVDTSSKDFILISNSGQVRVPRVRNEH